MTAAVGAVQQRAQIRLRWLREEIDDQKVERVPDWSENRERMSMEYIAPREIDIQGADGLVLLTSQDGAHAPEWNAFFDLLRKCGAGKRVAVFGDGLETGAVSAACHIVRPRTTPADPAAHALELGRALASALS